MMSSTTACTLPISKVSLARFSSTRGASSTIFSTCLLGRGFSFSRWFTSVRLVGMATVLGRGGATDAAGAFFWLSLWAIPAEAAGSVRLFFLIRPGLGGPKRSREAVGLISSKPTLHAAFGFCCFCFVHLPVYRYLGQPPGVRVGHVLPGRGSAPLHCPIPAGVRL